MTTIGGAHARVVVSILPSRLDPVLRGISRTHLGAASRMLTSMYATNIISRMQQKSLHASTQKAIVDHDDLRLILSELSRVGHEAGLGEADERS
ncbi:MAG: hypothetical protein AB7K04_15295 [Pseudorhodoplanes sp.]